MAPEKNEYWRDVVNAAMPDLSKVSRLPLAANDPDSGDDIDAALLEARQYLRSYNWGKNIKAEYLGYGAEGIVYIFLFEILPGRPDVPQWIWVIVGDVPPAYMPGDDVQTPYEVLDGYIGAMEDWVEAARQGKSVAKLIPVNVDANPANAEMLASRLAFLDEKVLPLLQE
ncbi:hypothetical protein EN794_051220 [Mesorhizobium sp. M00.F.Ca.ET.151.01.1.1]|nr:hypothetical protein EN746_05565 [Mesorhizobium sp. M8A.F.Ca.ET.023.02.2.1]RWC68861.1 MAG: hypothetical protein EOS30_23555 [Mesorhizobium sp.]TGR17800.1 hypothetical protein EN845_28970 [Mesorhizobium sp. M8A.F.Ca.ET.202.01.1.1]TGR19800.1 hypothetical protein EN840_28800 [Mesorhizobium sp. M8A.F.Ca.ET.197.01.1.1]TGR37716.1 hypothetical protein EN842_48840 [bacterium M00.F.Ca.ET.199.01.1.1]TGR43009.1 hypothetical protein EN841_28795 [Mesorhizobium sp. M8A.F.Ca.ET.198.01.1.1]TGU22698.1 hypo